MLHIWANLVCFGEPLRSVVALIKPNCEESAMCDFSGNNESRTWTPKSRSYGRNARIWANPLCFGEPLRSVAAAFMRNTPFSVPHGQELIATTGPFLRKMPTKSFGICLKFWNFHIPFQKFHDLLEYHKNHKKRRQYQDFIIFWSWYFPQCKYGEYWEKYNKTISENRKYPRDSSTATPQNTCMACRAISGCMTCPCQVGFFSTNFNSILRELFLRISISHRELWISFAFRQWSESLQRKYDLVYIRNHFAILSNRN